MKYSPLWKKTLIGELSDLNTALERIKMSGCFMAVIMNSSEKLIGIMTDSDIRGALLGGARLSDSVLKHMKKNPIIALESYSDQDLGKLVKSTGVREIPILDAEGKLVDIYIYGLRDKKKNFVAHSKFENIRSISNPMLILAGGLGSRLRSVVSDVPKPLAKVGDDPILKTILKWSTNCGFKNFYIAVNYMASKIEDHVEHAEYKDLNIKTIREEKRLGTAGSIGYFADEIKEDLIVSNADVLTKMPFHLLLDHHNKKEADITCAVRPYDLTVPYGVVTSKDGFISEIVEKPNKTYMVNAGIYVLSPRVCRMVEKAEYLDMPDLLNRVINEGGKVASYYMHEYWIDIGVPEDYHKANESFNEHFGDIANDKKKIG